MIILHYFVIFAFIIIIPALLSLWEWYFESQLQLKCKIGLYKSD